MVVMKAVVAASVVSSKTVAFHSSVVAVTVSAARLTLTTGEAVVTESEDVVLKSVVLDSVPEFDAVVSWAFDVVSPSVV
jgi:hypothetical protein